MIERLIIAIVVQILANMSPVIRDSIVVWIKELEAEAKKTDNPWDDILVMLLKAALGE